MSDSPSVPRALQCPRRSAFELLTSRFLWSPRQLHELLVDSGAQPCPNPKNGSESATRRFDLSQLTHFVTDTLDFPEYSLLSEHNRDRDEQQSAISDKKGKGKDKGVTGAVQGEDKPGDGRFKIVLVSFRPFRAETARR